MSEKGYVLVYELDGQTTQLPQPPPPRKKRKWHKLWLRSLVLFLLEKTYHRIT